MYEIAPQTPPHCLRLSSPCVTPLPLASTARQCGLSDSQNSASSTQLHTKPFFHSNHETTLLTYHFIMAISRFLQCRSILKKPCRSPRALSVLIIPLSPNKLHEFQRKSQQCHNKSQHFQYRPKNPAVYRSFQDYQMICANCHPEKPLLRSLVT